MNSSRQRKSGAVLSYVSIILTTLIQLLYTPFLIKMLGESEYGLYSLVYSIIGYLTILDLGFGNAIVVYTSKYRTEKKYEEEKRLHGMFFLIFCIISIFMLIIGLLLFFKADFFFGNTLTNTELSKMKIMLLILTFNLVITFPFNIYSSIITAYEEFNFQKILAIVNTLMKPIFMIPLLFLGFKSITMTLVITLVNMVVMFSNWYFCKRKLKIEVKYSGFDKKLFKTIFGYSIFIFLGVIVDKINWSVDQFILGALCGTFAVSIYSVASQINTLFINLATALTGVFLPKISKMVANKVSDKQLTDEFIKIGRIQCFIVFFMISSFILFGREFIIFWVGKKYINSYYILVILLVPSFFSLIQSLGISIMQAKNMHKFRSVLLFVISILNIVISIPLAKHYEGIGSAIGTSFSILIGNVLILNFYYYFKVKINVLKFWKTIFKMLIYFVIPIILIILFKNIFGIDVFVTFLIGAILYTISFGFISYFKVMNDYEKKLVDSFINKLRFRSGN